MTKTENNLLAAFAGESQANRRYLAFAQQAESEGKTNLARLFRVAADGETVHALAHFNVAGGAKSSAENLRAAITGETYEFTEMYPQFISEAKAEDNGPADISFWRANVVEKEHEQLFQAALEKNGDIEAQEYYVCQVCGHVHLGAAPDKCPVCASPKEKFKKVE
ncbi:MAG: rubrerythrin family protein [Parcubacteria group bacterium]|jgi:rubrerythrin